MNNHIQTAISEQGIEAYLHAQQHKSLLRFLTCGSVDDGKSTLIGRLLHDSQQIYEDQLKALESDSRPCPWPARGSGRAPGQQEQRRSPSR